MIPWCVLWKIRELYPEADGNYVIYLERKQDWFCSFWILYILSFFIQFFFYTIKKMKIHFPNPDFWLSITKALSGFGTPVILFGSLGIKRSSSWFDSFFQHLMQIPEILLFFDWFGGPLFSYFRESYIEAFISLPSCCLFQRNALVEIHCGKLTSNEHPNIRKMLLFSSPFIIKGMINFQNSCMTELGKTC